MSALTRRAAWLSALAHELRELWATFEPIDRACVVLAGALAVGIVASLQWSVA